MTRTKMGKRAQLPTHGTVGSRRWVSEVSRGGELFLKRRGAPAAPARAEMDFPFAQGLTFVARRWRNLMNEKLRDLGQSQARWGVLYWIAVFGDSVNQTELAERIGVEQPTLGRVLSSLEEEGFIERRAGAGDKRAKVIRLTAAAKPAMKQIARIGNAVTAKLLQGIAADDLMVCVSVFAKILENIEAD